MATSDILAIVQSAPDVSADDATWVASLVAQAQAAIAAFCNLPAFPTDPPADGAVSNAPSAAEISLLEAICAQIALEAYRVTAPAPESYDDTSTSVVRAAESFGATMARYKGLLTRFRRLAL